MEQQSYREALAELAALDGPWTSAALDALGLRLVPVWTTACVHCGRPVQGVAVLPEGEDGPAARVLLDASENRPHRCLGLLGARAAPRKLRPVAPLPVSPAEQVAQAVVRLAEQVARTTHDVAVVAQGVDGLAQVVDGLAQAAERQAERRARPPAERPTRRPKDEPEATPAPEEPVDEMPGIRL